jgi:Uncharacterized protein conserved in bacteria
MANQTELDALRAENARLIALLETNGIEWRLSASPAEPANNPEPSKISTPEKLRLFSQLFRGRSDVYAVRWESKTTGKSGYTPACANDKFAVRTNRHDVATVIATDRRIDVCEKPRIKCSECSHRSLLPLSDAGIYDHLIGNHTIGIYPLLEDDSCYFLAVDFDEAEWRDDASAFAQSCAELGVPVALEISRSGQGAHAWVFFSGKVSARDARRLGSAVISYTCNRTRQLKLASYDRLFPNQDSMPKGGFGNLIALPLQKRPRENNCSVFVDRDFRAYPDQWAFLAAIEPMSPEDIEPVILHTTGGTHPLDITFIDDEDLAKPWQTIPSSANKLTGTLPEAVTVTLANMIYLEKVQLPQVLANRLIRLAAFQNPEFYKAQAMRMSVWNKPRVIGCAENFPQHIALPRGCLDAVRALMHEHGIRCELRDERFSGVAIDARFAGALRDDQEAAVAAMLLHDAGVLCAPTAFGKTVTAAALIATRAVNTLVLVHRTELLKQWQERLQAFLDLGEHGVGVIGSGKAKPTGKIDIAVMQSLSRQHKVDPLVETYGQIIVDECHHIGAASFDAILKQAKAKFVLGLTATPIRRDGQQPIIFMQCGPIRHTANKPLNAPHDLVVLPRLHANRIDLPSDSGIQDVFRHIANDPGRTSAIAIEVKTAISEKRKVLVLTERNEHLQAIGAALADQVGPLFVLHGRMSKKQRSALVYEMEALPATAPRILLSTGKLVGEGFDHPPLDTLILAMPVSWKGTLQQYAGRLHREHEAKSDVRIIDFVDTGHPALLRMWNKRLRGYRAMGYRIVEDVI